MITKTKRFPCIGLDETDFHLANSTSLEANFTSGTYPYNNVKDSGIYGDIGGNNYGRINVDKAVSTESYVYALFDLSEIPDYATITSTDGKIRLYSSGSQASYRQIRWCLDNIDTPLRTSQNYSTSSNPAEISVTPLQTNITVSDLKRVRCHIRYVRNSRTDNTQRYIYLYGACIDVTWVEPELHVKQNGEWKKVKDIWVKQNGVWVKQNQLYIDDTNPAHILQG